MTDWFAILIVTIFAPIGVNGQTGFKPGDIVTFSESRTTHSIVIAHDRVEFYTNGGIWKLDRTTLRPSDPEYAINQSLFSIPNGGFYSAVFSVETGSTWAISPDGLFVRPFGFSDWRLVNSYFGSDGELGSRNDTIFIRDGNEITAVAEFGYRYLGRVNVSDAGIKWSWNRAFTGEIPFLHTDDPAFRFETSDGSLIDWNLNRFRPGISAVDLERNRRFIAYPGLGIAIVDDQIGRLELFEPGPSGGIRTIAFGAGGVIYAGGRSSLSPESNGIFAFDRRTGRWKRLGGRDLVTRDGIEILDIELKGNFLIAATSEGLLYGDVQKDRWKYFSGASLPSGSELWFVRNSGSGFLAGGPDGVAYGEFENGAPVFYPNLLKMSDDDGDIAAISIEADSLWIAGMGGLGRYGAGKTTWMAPDDGLGVQPLSALALSNNWIAVGGEYGLQLLQRSEGTWTALASKTYFDNEAILSVAIDRNIIWVGSTASIYRYDIYRGSVIKIGSDQGIPRSAVFQLELEADTLWAVSSAGLTRVNKRAEFFNR